jgi:hypothetical protein
MIISIGKDVLSTTQFQSVYTLNVTPLVCCKWLLSLDNLDRYEAHLNLGFSNYFSSDRETAINIKNYMDLYTAYTYEYAGNLVSLIIDGYYKDINVSFCVDFSASQLRIRTCHSEVLDELHELITSEILE